MTPSPILHCVRKVEAVIDWLTIEFMTLARHNGGKLKEKLGASHVTPLDPGPGGYATHFRARFQDPGPFAQIHQTLQDTGVAIEQGVAVCAIEISMDFYAHGNDLDTLEEIAAHLYKFAAKVADQRNQRTISGRCSPTYYIGNQGSDSIPADPVSQRIYTKTTDNKQQLPPELHRARYEITLTESGLPFTTLDQAAAFSFTELAPWFKWRMLKSDLEFLQLVAINACKQIGARKAVKLRQGGRREFDRRTVADIELDKRAYDALRALTRRSRRGIRSFSSDFSEPKWTGHRGNQGGFSNNSTSLPSPVLNTQPKADNQQGAVREYDEELIAELAQLIEPVYARANVPFQTHGT